MKKTKIVCTIGPACESQAILEKMIRAGMNVARLNFSHGTYAHHSKLIKNIRAVSKKIGQPVAIMQDLQGPRIRIGEVNKNGVELTKGKRVALVPEKALDYKLLSRSSAKILPIQYANLFKMVKKGNRILIHDGLIELTVHEVVKNIVYANVTRGGIILSHKGINIPGVNVKMPVITEKDKEDLKFGLKERVDFVALSFVASDKNIKDLRRLINKFQPKSEVKIISKIERREAIKNFSKILEAVDAVMVARGDLGVEMPAEEVPILQKQIIDRCIRAGKPVIVATQMLDSMIRSPRPTRAEASDVANAVIDHADAVMLSGETAFGKYPVESTRMMDKIIIETEKSAFDDLPHGYLADHYRGIYYALADGAHELSKHTRAKFIVAATTTGKTAAFVSRHRPDNAIIIALAHRDIVLRQLVLVWGVYPSLVPRAGSLTQLIVLVNKSLKRCKLGKLGDRYILITGHPLDRKTSTNLLAVREIK